MTRSTATPHHGKGVSAMPVEEAVEMDSREAEFAFKTETFRESSATRTEGGSGRSSTREIRVGETQELWGEMHNLQQEHRDIRATIDSRETKMETALERMRSEIRDNLKTLETKLETAVDKLRTELTGDISQLRNDSKADLRQLSEKLDWHRSESAREAKGSTRWSMGTVIVAGFTMITMAATVVVALIMRVH